MKKQKITKDNPYSSTYDLDNCDKEPIHIIQTIQRFACLIAVSSDPAFQVEQASTNVGDFLEVAHENILGKSLNEFIDSDATKRLKQAIKTKHFLSVNPVVLPYKDDRFKERLLSVHQTEGQLFVEIEHRQKKESELYFLSKVDHAIQRIQSSAVSQNLFQIAAQEIKKVTGYDRVMIYQFDQDYNGEVVAEAKEAHQEAFFGIRYPATDIPKQARELFLKNRVRMLTDVNDDFAFIRPSLHPSTNAPSNLSMTASRGVSPIHLEYLRNMGVGASLTVAIVEDNKLWGLIACHHQEKKVIDYQTRSLIKFMGSIISGHLSLQRATEYRENILKNNIIHARLFEHMNQQQNIIKGLTEGKYGLLDFIPGDGAVILFEKEIVRVGKTPTEAQILTLVDWLSKNTTTNVYATDQIITVHPDFADFANDFAGVLSVNLSSNTDEYIIWFRQPQEKEVVWGGDPNKAKTRSEKTGRLTPRKSFEKWKEIVANQSIPWEEQEKEAALKLRNDIKDILLKKFDQLKRLHDELNRSYLELESFSYTVSHDLRSPLRGIEGFAQILLEDYADRMDEFGLEVINTIIKSVNKMNAFINDILKLSKLAELEISFEEIDMHQLLHEIVEEQQGTSDKQVAITIKNCPPIKGDQVMIRQLFTNLISNAIKYSRPIKEAYIIIEGEEKKNQISYSVKDNGIGFDIKFLDKIFDVFSRLVSEDEYEGTGIGLSIVKRVVDRHQAEIKVESQLDKGSLFQVNFSKNYA